MSAPRDVVAGAAAQYRAAREDAVLADRSDLGRLLIEGADALDLLHRLTTNDLLSLQPGEGTAAAFVTAKGRLIDLVERRGRAAHRSLHLPRGGARRGREPLARHAGHLRGARPGARHAIVRERPGGPAAPSPGRGRDGGHARRPGAFVSPGGRWLPPDGGGRRPARPAGGDPAGLRRAHRGGGRVRRGPADRGGSPGGGAGADGGLQPLGGAP